MTISTPIGPILLADSIRDLSAHRYLLFNQAWAYEIGIGADMYAQDGHLNRLGTLLTPESLPAARLEHAHTVMGFTNLTQPVPVSYQAAVLAPLVVSINGQPRNDTSATGLEATAAAILATGLTQQQLVEACDESKKNFKPN